MKYSSNPDTITRDFFDSLLLETRYIDSVLPSTKMTLWGETFDTPVMTAALSHLHNTAQDGMSVYAEGAAKAGAVHWVGMGEDEELERVVATRARSIKIIKPHADNKEVFRKIEHAVAQGCIAVGMDTDHAFNSNGGYDDVFGLPMKPKSTAELKEFVQAAGVPFIVKGVSHHHGMVQYSVPPLMVMQDIISAAGPDVQVFIDCGIASGMDVYKCLALGAKAVSVGRHLMPLLKNGPEAVAQRIKEMTAELAGIMARTGVATLEDMDPTVIHRRNF